MTAQFRLVNHAYCGMSIPIKEGDRDDVRSAAARYLRRLRREGFPVAVMTKGQEWEIQEPEDCVMVPDECGMVTLRAIPVKTYRCFECGDDVPEGESCDCRLCGDCGNEWGYCSCNREEEES